MNQRVKMRIRRNSKITAEPPQRKASPPPAAPKAQEKKPIPRGNFII